MNRLSLVVVMAASLAGQAAHTQNFFARYEARTTRYQADQPKWMVPVIAPYPMLAQVARADFTRQITPTLVHNWNLGASRGLNIVPLKNTEIDILVPPFIEHGDVTRDGFGDFSFTGKYRFFSGNEKHGNYVVTGLLSMTVPTGSYNNGLSKPTVTPSLSGGKGFGKFNAYTTLGGVLPSGNVRGLGRNIVSNTVFQYHVQKYLYPELEINSTAYFSGPRDGKIQTFVAPGIIFGKFALHPHNPKSRLGLAAGFGFQVATTTYHTYNHNAIFTGRFVF